MGVALAPSKVLVTGANGYIAMWVIQILLDQGYTVRGTIRSREKVKEFKRFQGYIDRGKLEFAVVKDIAQDGAFDAAVRDVDGIIHIVAPVVLTAEVDPQEMIIPAVSGTLGVLNSGLKHGNSLKRVVATSTSGAIIVPVKERVTFDESGWNEHSVQMAEKFGKHASPIDKYRASKTLAEKALWKFNDEHKNEIQWDVSVMNPPLVCGPALNSLLSPSHQNATSKLFWDLIIAEPPTPKSVSEYNEWLDVRDLALAHVLALQKPEAGGERIIVSAGTSFGQDWVDIASTYRSPLKTHQFPHHKEFNGYLPKGFPDIPREPPFEFDISKACRIFGSELTYRSKEETLRDVLADYAARGW